MVKAIKGTICKHCRNQITGNKGDPRFETENLTSETLQSEFDRLFETNNMVDRINREQRESRFI